ncbi:SRPBCC family protein [Micromonospora kangleipakensis]|uniref:SRPBCC family protein n=1 Tax=Micromonospora kangleipakensis TaxID=1077942 RepID=UPI001F5FB564|nr:SRPBCC family protein [Micromonospora kangleipakensis]
MTDTLGIERASQDRPSEGLARLLGWFSLGLGAAALGARSRVGRLSGIDGSPTAQTVLRIAGVRELGHAAALLVPRRAGWGAWTRVAGDAMDLAACGRALQGRRGERRRRLTYTTVAVAGITAVDLYTAVRVARRRRPEGNEVHAAVTVNRSVEDVYRFWHDFENLPRFMHHLQSVRMTGDRRSRWTAKAPAGRRVVWDAEVVDDRPNERISWRSVPRAKVPNAGTVRFMRAAGGRGTEVRVQLGYRAPGGMLGARVAKLFGEDPQQQVCDDLRRFKQVIETGEIVRSDASPEGSAVQQQMKQRPARPLATRGAGR